MGVPVNRVVASILAIGLGVTVLLGAGFYWQIDYHSPVNVAWIFASFSKQLMLAAFAVLLSCAFSFWRHRHNFGAVALLVAFTILLVLSFMPLYLSHTSHEEMVAGTRRPHRHSIWHPGHVH